MKKKCFILTLISLLVLPFALADLGQTLSNIWWKILSLGNLSFLGLSDGSIVATFTRILIWILMFTVFFGVITTFSKGEKAVFAFLNRGQAGVIAAVVATIAAVFLPAQVLLATGAGWATAIALLLIGGPVVGLWYLAWKIPGKEAETKATVFIKILLCFLLLWILSAMKYHVTRMI